MNKCMDEEATNPLRNVFALALKTYKLTKGMVNSSNRTRHKTQTCGLH